MEGDDIRRLIMGEEWVRSSPGGRDGGDASGDSGSGDPLAHFSALAREHVWNTFWVRDGLDLRMRSAVTIAALVSLEASEELVAHVNGALRAGLLSKVEIREAILQLTPYLGYPRVRHALAQVNSDLAEDENGDGGEAAG
ncbi:MAG: carboxymuconolactone decarboxylase family protein [Sporichthyaceae bacterium]|nr:carboxymuconolactone decarboxylase family protein [Sporichthyaceae bacterium]